MAVPMGSCPPPPANAGGIILVQAKLAPYLHALDVLYSVKIWECLHLPVVLRSNHKIYPSQFYCCEGFCNDCYKFILPC